MNMTDLQLRDRNMTQRERELVSRAAMDIESGNHLLYPRSYSELAMVDEVLGTLNTPEDKRTERQKELYEEYRLCTDYDYWKSKQQ
jgi:hypothetical protein